MEFVESNIYVDCVLYESALESCKMSRKHSVVNQQPCDDLQTSSSTKTTTMTTAAKLYGKDLSEYDDIDVDKLLSELTPEELNILAKEVDPDVSLLLLKINNAIAS